MAHLQRIDPLVLQPQPIFDRALPRLVLLREVVHPTLESGHPRCRRHRCRRHDDHPQLHT
jgi:hypothetical protein